jgi:hypothetical protein
LAHRFERLLQAGAVKDYATLARLGHVSRARICQIVSLLQLAPDIQEEILFLGCPERGRGPLHLRQVRPLAAVPKWVSNGIVQSALFRYSHFPDVSRRGRVGR